MKRFKYYLITSICTFSMLAVTNKNTPLKTNVQAYFIPMGRDNYLLQRISNAESNQFLNFLSDIGNSLNNTPLNSEIKVNINKDFQKISQLFKEFISLLQSTYDSEIVPVTIRKNPNKVFSTEDLHDLLDRLQKNPEKIIWDTQIERFIMTKNLNLSNIRSKLIIPLGKISESLQKVQKELQEKINKNKYAPAIEILKVLLSINEGLIGMTNRVYQSFNDLVKFKLAYLFFHHNLITLKADKQLFREIMEEFILFVDREAKGGAKNYKNNMLDLNNNSFAFIDKLDEAFKVFSESINNASEKQNGFYIGQIQNPTKVNESLKLDENKLKASVNFNLFQQKYGEIGNILKSLAKVKGNIISIKRNFPEQQKYRRLFSDKSLNVSDLLLWIANLNLLAINKIPNDFERILRFTISDTNAKKEIADIRKALGIK